MKTRSVALHRRLGFRLAVVVALTTALGMAAVSYVLVRQERANLTEQLTLRTLSEARNLALAASAPLLRHDPELGLHPLILRALEEVTDLEELVVVDARGNIVGHEDLLRVGEPFEAIDGTAVDLPALHGSESARRLDDAIVLQVPIVHLDERVGSLVATVSRAGIDEAVSKAVTQALFVSAIGVLLVTLLIIVLVARSLAPLAELRASVQRIGSGDLNSRTRVRTSNELGMLAELIDEMAAGLAQAQVERLQKERIDHELSIAHDLQTMLLPKRIPAPQGYELAAHYEAALEVSGDYYDIVELDRGRFALIVADVSGKGVPGLVVMAMLRTVARQLALAGADPKQLLVTAHDILQSSIPKGMFVTCLCGILDTREHRFDYANAGHCPPICFDANGRAEYLPTGGKALGMFPSSVLDHSLELRRQEFSAGEGLVVYTDGLTEAMNAERQPIGEEEIRRCLADACPDSAREALAALRRRVSDHQGEAAAADDLTLFVFGRDPAPIDTQQRDAIDAVEELFQ